MKDNKQKIKEEILDKLLGSVNLNYEHQIYNIIMGTINDKLNIKNKELEILN